MTSRTELRSDRNTAAHIARALKLQQQCGYDYARSHLHSVGVSDELARRLLAIRVDRRQAPAAGAAAAAAPNNGFIPPATVAAIQ